jgi:hypothetical protein
MSLCLITKGRISKPESTMTQGIVCLRGLFLVYAQVKAKWVFIREKVVRSFSVDKINRSFKRGEMDGDG